MLLPQTDRFLKFLRAQVLGGWGTSNLAECPTVIAVLFGGIKPKTGEQTGEQITFEISINDAG